MGFNLTTFLFETVNFVVLVWVLQRLVYRPLQRAIQQRQAAMDAREQKAESAQELAEARQRQLEEESKGLDAVRERVIREATEQAAEERARILRSAHEDAASERSRVQKLLAAEREAAIGWVREMAIEHSTEVAGRLLAELAPDALDEALIEQLLTEIRLEELPAGAERDEVEITFTHRPTEQIMAMVRNKLEANLGIPPRLVQREDESLGAGAVVRIGGKVFDASLSGQLEAFRGRVRTLIEPEVTLG